ncbi:MAG: TonB-dependent receptor [Xanthomonadaceae bacterium]|nr:TonB-dependent receptor [Xanthomonadaceae bacterium]
MNRGAKRVVPTLLAASVLLALAGPVAAQDTQATSVTSQQQSAKPSERANQPATLSTVVVTGTRVLGRTLKDSLQPVDVVSGETLRQTGAFDFGTALSRAIPSLNFPMSPASDLEAFQRPFQLRSMPPDEVLVLVDGKRWHPGALVMTLANIGVGSQGYDLNTIPLSAVDHIEVLRDGASAQYGSDAIAGVVNVILKKGAQGGSVTATVGQYSAGDGRTWRGAGNFGVALGDKGWMRFSLEDGGQDETNRAEPDVRAGLTQYGTLFHYGVVPFKDSNALINGQYDITPNVQFYAYGHFGRREGTPYDFYRYGLNTTHPKSPWLAISPFPDGFLPHERGVSTDSALVAGLRGSIDGWNWDVSANTGGNRVSYATENTTNFAMLADFGTSPTEFHDGILRAKQQTFDVDISKPLDVSWLSHPLNVAFGTQWLRQSYSVAPGDLGSYYISTTHTDATGGAQGFAGWSPADAISVARHSLAEYVQLESNLTDAFDMSLSARHSNYSDFGGNTSYALSGRYEFNKAFALRGTVSTGFRAPTLGQEHYFETSSTSFGAGNNLGLPEGIYLRGIVPSTMPLARLLGGEPLKPEKARNYTIGAVWTPNNAFTATLDLYQVTVDNRIALSSTIPLTTPAVLAYLASHGVTAPGYSGFNYFTNAGTVRSQGIDLVTTYRSDFGNAGSLMTTLSADYHKNKVTKVEPNPAILDSLGVNFQRLNRNAIKGLMADAAPRSKLILDERYDIGNWEVGGTLTRYGSVTSYSSTSYLFDQVYSPEWTLDLNVNYFMNNWTFTLGGDNVLDSYPDRTRVGQNTNGVFPYSQLSPFGFSGAYFYGKIAYRW